MRIIFRRLKVSKYNDDSNWNYIKEGTLSVVLRIAEVRKC